MWLTQSENAPSPRPRNPRLPATPATHARGFRRSPASTSTVRPGARCRCTRRELPATSSHRDVPCNCRTPIPATRSRTAETPLPWRACAEARNRQARRPCRKSRPMGRGTVPPSQHLPVLCLAELLRVAPHQKLPKRRAPVAVSRLLFRTEFGKRRANLWKVKQRIVSEPARTARRVEDYSFRRATKAGQRLPIARGHQYANESSRAPLRRDLPQLSQNSGVVGLLARILIRQVRLVRRIPG